MVAFARNASSWEEAVRKAAAAVRAGRSANPMNWLFDNPLGSDEQLTFGVLKRSYGGYANSVCLFGFHKLNPVPPKRGADESFAPRFTCYRSDVVLPTDADDALDSEVELLIAIEESACSHDPSLLVYVTLSFPEATRLHHCWNESVAFATEAFARKRQLPVVAVQHRPGEVGSSNPVHVHLLVGPRRLDGTGFRGYAHDILCDEGQRVLSEEWASFRALWRKGRTAQSRPRQRQLISSPLQPSRA